MMIALRRVFAAAALLCVAAPALFAQQQPRRIPAYAELRGDAIFARHTSLQGGAGVVVPGGVYVRFNVDATGGVQWHDGETRAAGRVDAIARFLLDPFRERPVGLSLGGGMTLPYAEGDARVRPYMTAVIDVEGHMSGRWTPALQVGLGGGTRVGLVLRRSARGWR